MIENFRRFLAGPDPFGRTWDVVFRWQQNGISIRHADTIDVKFTISHDGGEPQEKVIALTHPDLLVLSREAKRPVSDSWVSYLAAEHLREMILTGEDMEKTLITAPLSELRRYQQSRSAAPAAR